MIVKWKGETDFKSAKDSVIDAIDLFFIVRVFSNIITQYSCTVFHPAEDPFGILINFCPVLNLLLILLTTFALLFDKKLFFLSLSNISSLNKHCTLFSSTFMSSSFLQSYSAEDFSSSCNFPINC